MTTLIKALVALFIVSFTISLNAQNFQGVATYKTQRKLDLKMDSTSHSSISKEMHSQMVALMKKQFQKTFKLTFNKEASVYKQEEALSKPQVAGGNVQVIMIGEGGGSDVLYKNTKEQRYTEQVDTYGKLFLVKDQLEKIDWKLGSETKYIGEYPCYKATYTKMVPKSRTITANAKNDIDLDTEPELEELIVTAWYTPQIPVNNGPRNYHGLPGLILEIHDGDETIVCSKIVLNPKETVAITEPTKGKQLNQEKYDAIIEKKAKEMLERYRPKKGGRNDGESFSISIGG